ncbi:hypothetical protein DWY99_13065, partial [[Clostridium] leptum]
FRFHLTMNTLAFGYILPTTGRIPDLHRLETCAAGRTVKSSPPGVPRFLGNRSGGELFVRFFSEMGTALAEKSKTA